MIIVKQIRPTAVNPSATTPQIIAEWKQYIEETTKKETSELFGGTQNDL